MARRALTVISILWLIVVLPFLGIIPLLILLEVNIGELYQIEMALLRDLWGLFYNDPSLGVADAPPPISEQQILLMVVIVFTLSVVAICYCGYCFKRWRKSTWLR